MFGGLLILIGHCQEIVSIILVNTGAYYCLNRFNVKIHVWRTFLYFICYAMRCDSILGKPVYRWLSEKKTSKTLRNAGRSPPRAHGSYILPLPSGYALCLRIWRMWDSTIWKNNTLAVLRSELIHLKFPPTRCVNPCGRTYPVSVQCTIHTVFL